MNSKLRPRLVVFDCDGTLVDSQATILASMSAAWAEAGLDAPSPERVRAIIGLSLDEAMQRLAGDIAPERARALADNYRRAFKVRLSRPEHEDPLYPAVVETLDALTRAQVVLAVATGKGSSGLRATLGQHGLLDRFVSLQTADRARGKPHPEMLHNAMRDADIGPERTLMVGDTVHDVQMAANAGVAAIGVSWGYHAAEDLRDAGARVVIDSMTALLPAVDRLLPP
ncbi:MAG: HAD family hydrolase [Alphaproteobacteria bacterium]|nr:HAD family hydrolase [Alphaproteobacteria bacterium]